jgi:AcrR family transcriptional regulator
MPSVTRKSQPGSRAERRAAIVQRLLAVVEGFMEAGESYTELSVERLVGEAGLSRSTFYVYFEDKGDLLRALTEDLFRDILAAAQVWWDMPADASKDEVRDSLRSLMDTYVTHRLLMGAVVETSAYDDGVREVFEAMMDVSARGVADHLRDGQKQGFVHPELDVDRVAEWTTWMTERGFYELVRPAGAKQRERLLTALTDIVWNSFYEGRR